MWSIICHHYIQLCIAHSQGSELFDEAINPNAYIYGQGMDSNDGNTDNSSDNDESDVVVSLTQIPLSPNSLQQLRNAINPNERCDDFGKQLYIGTVRLVYTHMQNDSLVN